MITFGCSNEAILGMGISVVILTVSREVCQILQTMDNKQRKYARSHPRTHVNIRVSFYFSLYFLSFSFSLTDIQARRHAPNSDMSLIMALDAYIREAKWNGERLFPCFAGSFHLHNAHVQTNSSVWAFTSPIQI